MNTPTLIITTYNDWDNLFTTVASAYFTALVEPTIVVVDDFHGGPPDPRIRAKPFLHFIRTPHRLGVSGARHFGIDYARNLGRSDWFILSDSHMLFPKGWDASICYHVETNDMKTTLSGVYTVLEPPFDLSNPVRLFGGAWHEFINSDDHTYRFDWSTFLPFVPDGKSQREIPIMAGALYVLNHEWFEYLRGWEGFQFYGSEEACYARKGWLAGGRTVLMADVKIGHMTQPIPPGRTTLPMMAYNQFHSLRCTCTSDEFDLLSESVPHFGLWLAGMEEFRRRELENALLYQYLDSIRVRTNDDWSKKMKTPSVEETVKKFQEKFDDNDPWTAANPEKKT